MTTFKILQKDPTLYKEQILKFWLDCLPGTPPSRFEWMNNGNPAGPAIWFFAFEEKSNELAGTISIMPKNIILNGQSIQVGILGDFMINKKYRVFGPNLQLLRTVQESLTNLGLKFIYTIPNTDSEKLIKRVGAKDIGVLKYMGRLLETKKYFEKYTNPLLAKLMASLVEHSSRILLRESFVSIKGSFEELNEANSSFDLLWKKIKVTQTGIIGDHSSGYLNWRYFQNPLYKFRVLTYKKEKGGDILGYIFFTIYDRKLEIFDIVAIQKSYADKLLKKIIHIALKESCYAIYIAISKSNQWFKKLKSYFFFDTKYDMRIYFIGNYLLHMEKQNLFGGDRNI